ncbi:MAG: methyltransferase domain-containing protein [Desulfobacteraceae bacterium]|nr:MAG: methyltransferase domain-containing protein [Desulfobacteraceae bacterium]
MAFNKNQIARIYHERAQHYDLTANLYYLFGLREFAYRKKAVQALSLKPGDTVVELGCGTGLNFHFLQKKISPHGQIIGVDLTGAMLAKARQRARRNRWNNINLVQSDAASFGFPQRVDGVLSTFALTLVPEYDRVIQNCASALPAGKRCVILDFKKPEHWPNWLIQTYARLTKPFGVTLDLAERHLCKSVRSHMDLIDFKEFYFGAIYICVGAPA